MGVELLAPLPLSECDEDPECEPPGLQTSTSSKTAGRSSVDLDLGEVCRRESCGLGSGEHRVLVVTLDLVTVRHCCLR